MVCSFRELVAEEVTAWKRDNPQRFSETSVQYHRRAVQAVTGVPAEPRTREEWLERAGCDEHGKDLSH